MAEKGCLQHHRTLNPYQPTGIQNFTSDDICVYVIFNSIMLSLQNFSAFLPNAMQRYV